jgi:mannose-6-phosphate isomerase-like protein (cupin superfamily)
MDVNKITLQLQSQFPGKTIIKVPERSPGEILCEVDPTSEHPEYSKAIAIIDRSIPHVHYETKETYKVLKGSLVVHISGVEYPLKEGESIVIEPDKIHWAEGKETWVECYSEPGWRIDDHVRIYTLKRKQPK